MDVVDVDVVVDVVVVFFVVDVVVVGSGCICFCVISGVVGVVVVALDNVYVMNVIQYKTIQYNTI